MSNVTPWPKPKVPDLEQRLPFIWRQFMDPCDAPITIWVEAFWPAFVNALLSWFAVDASQILMAYIRPGVGRWYTVGYRHVGGGKRGSRKPGGKWWEKISGWDPNEVIAKEIGGWQELKGFELLPGEVEFWLVEEVIEKEFFWWMVLDLSTTFLYEWTSGVAKSKYCQARDDAVLLAEGGSYPLQGIFGWDEVGAMSPTKMRNIAFFDGFGVMQTVASGVVSVYFTATNVGGGIGPAWIEFRMVCGNGPRAGPSPAQRHNQSDANSIRRGATAQALPGEIWWGEIRVNGTWIIDKPSMHVHAVAH